MTTTRERDTTGYGMRNFLGLVFANDEAGFEMDDDNVGSQRLIVWVGGFLFFADEVAENCINNRRVNISEVEDWIAGERLTIFV